MKIIHTADLHLGQFIYQNYDRTDEHDHFFKQLEDICKEENPDALIVSGDVFDSPQTSAANRKYFTERFVAIRTLCPTMKIVITAGNHDSPSNIQADSAVWKLADATIIGQGPSPDLLSAPDGWQEKFIVKLDNGYIVALPHMSGERTGLIQSILDYVDRDNKERKAVVMMGHLAVTGSDVTGHGTEIGTLNYQSIDSLGKGYDYLALGHIHKPQTIGHPEDCMKDDVTYPSGVIRYSGSALHVSCDEKYPHSVSIVEIGSHGGEVRIRQRRTDQFRHFFELPADGNSFTTAEEALDALKAFAAKEGKGYFRFHFDRSANLPSDFCSSVYDAIASYKDDIRYNPRHEWEGEDEKAAAEAERPVFEVADLQQMEDPMEFIERTIDLYPGLDLEEIRKSFEEVKKEIEVMIEEEANKAPKGARKGTKKTADAPAENAEDKENK